MPLVRFLPAALIAVLVLAACGEGSEAAGPPSEPSSEPAAGGDAAGTMLRAEPLQEALDRDASGPVTVTGLLIDDGSGWRLCGTVLESYPPQCGEPSVAVEAVDPEIFNLQSANGVRWADGATVLGDLEGGTLTVTGDARAS